MARQMLLKSLVSVFGDFVDGLTEENLKVGVGIALLACEWWMDECTWWMDRSVDQSIAGLV